MDAAWKNTSTIETRVFVCGYCNTKVSSDKGYHDERYNSFIWLCPCGKPTYFDLHGSQYPAYICGNKISGIPSKDIEQLYEEARRCTSVSAYTAAVLSCRKLLMHIAVEKGAPEGMNFIQYVEYLSEKNYVPPDGKGWVDYIRQKSNEANHEIVLMKEKEAIDLINFSEMLLRFVYEFPSKVTPTTP